MNPKQREKFQIRANIARMAFWNNSVSKVHEMLKEWTLLELFELLDDRYMFMDEQKEIIISAFEYVAEQMYDEMCVVIDRIEIMRKIPTARDDLIDLIKLVGKMRKQWPAAEFKLIRQQDEKWDKFFKEYPKLKREYDIK